MNLPKRLALVLCLALVAASCGGDGPTAEEEPYVDAMRPIIQFAMGFDEEEAECIGLSMVRHVSVEGFRDADIEPSDITPWFLQEEDVWMPQTEEEARAFADSLTDCGVVGRLAIQNSLFFASQDLDRDDEICAADALGDNAAADSLVFAMLNGGMQSPEGEVHVTAVIDAFEECGIETRDLG